MPARVLMLTLLLSSPVMAQADDLILLLQQRSCPNCRLADVDLVHADLRDADLQRVQLQRANLGQACLDGADLSGADLIFTSMRGASLRGAKLRGAKLFGTDLRDADLTGAMLDANALEGAHWSGAKGMHPQAQMAGQQIATRGAKDQANHPIHSRGPRTRKQLVEAGKEPVRLLDNRNQRSDQRSTHQRLPVAAAHHHGTRLLANQHPFAANDPSVPNNTPSSCCSPASTPA